METQTSLSNTNEKQKPGPKAKPRVDVDALERRVHNLEELLVRMAHQSGVSHVLIKKAGLSPYEVTKGDMGKFKVI